MEGEIALLIPIVGTIGFFAVTALIVFWVIKASEKKSRFEHDQRMLAIEKGVDIPMAPAKEKNPFIWPFIWIGIGLAMLISFGVIGDEDWPGLWGLLPLFIGAGMLAARMLFRKYKKETILNSQSGGLSPVKRDEYSRGDSNV